MVVDGQEVDRAVGNVGQARLQQMLSLAQRGSAAGITLVLNRKRLHV